MPAASVAAVDAVADPGSTASFATGCCIDSNAAAEAYAADRGRTADTDRWNYGSGRHYSRSGAVVPAAAEPPRPVAAVPWSVHLAAGEIRVAAPAVASPGFSAADAKLAAAVPDVAAAQPVADVGAVLAELFAGCSAVAATQVAVPGASAVRPVAVAVAGVGAALVEPFAANSAAASTPAAVPDATAVRPVFAVCSFQNGFARLEPGVPLPFPRCAPVLPWSRFPVCSDAGHLRLRPQTQETQR